MKDLFTYWYIWMPLLAYAVYILLANSDSDDDDDNDSQHLGG